MTVESIIYSLLWIHYVYVEPPVPVVLVGLRACPAPRACPVNLNIYMGMLGNGKVTDIWHS